MNQIDELGNAHLIMDFFVPLVNPYRSGAIVVNAFRESSLNPNAVGDHDTAFGLFQLHPSRANIIKHAVGIDLTALPPVEDQCKAIWWELQHVELHALVQLTNSGNGYDATLNFCRFFERPADQNEPMRRAELYETWATKLGIAP